MGAASTPLAMSSRTSCQAYGHAHSGHGSLERE
jgi:hypothetical protein